MILLRLMAILAIPVALSGCGDTRKALGLDRSSPDEFTVINRAPLSLPPNFNQQPTRGAGSSKSESTDSRALTATEQAEQALFGQNNQRSTERTANYSPSAGENAFLDLAGYTKTTQEEASNIRETVDQEAKVAQMDKTFVQKMLFWQNKDQPGKAVDPKKEYKTQHDGKLPGDM
ncbi:MAG: DUF3035 domain-containing protein [Alphaproteobacteria bacterium]|jgi:hypothetical protein|nr:DUF3035 domain-containing protein [Alphaproteobacteria bacterium]MBT5389373.1 DUF3035 domain-containing protein [Alphaproteobacteria bacterium]MBT5654320.1 DUF3035 domain-containing protein [Alphaproteobacteria bacterium]